MKLEDFRNINLDSKEFKEIENKFNFYNHG